MNGTGQHGFYVNANNVTIKDLTIENVRNHAIQTDTNTDNIHIKNCAIRDTGEQMVKVPYSSSVTDPSENGIIEDCLFEYSAGVGPRYYIGGVDVHLGTGWIVRNNTFRDIQSLGGGLAGHAIHFWSNSEDTLVERNTIINCDRGIGFGLGSSPHIGGTIRNNMIYHDGSGVYADVGIGLESSSNTKIHNNTIFFDHNRYSNAIEYRWSETVETHIANNLTNKLIVSRNGGSGTLENNIINAQGKWFIDLSLGDLHLSGPISEVVDQGVDILDLTTDIDGDHRPQGKGIDIGADQYRMTISIVPYFQLILVDGH